jgi:prohibitin 1
MVPMLQYPIFMNVRTRPRQLTTVTGTKDLQQVNLSLRILSHPIPGHIKEIYRTLGPDYDDRILPSVGLEVLKAVVAQYNADQLLTLRDKVSNQIRASLHRRAQEFNIVLDDVSITHLNFSQDFAAAIEHKQVAQQLAERAKFVVQKAEQEKRALIIQSEGDAEAARLVSSAISQSGRGLIELRRIETALSVAQILARSRNITYIPTNQNMLFNVSG